MEEFQFYRVNELTKILSVSRASIYNWLNKGTFPKPIKISDSVSVWRKSDIEEWVSDRDQIGWPKQIFPPAR